MPKRDDYSYERRFREQVLDHIMVSTIGVTWVDHKASEIRDVDIRRATELGALLLLGKPIILAVSPGQTVPPGLARAADVIVRDFDASDPASQDRMADAIRSIQPSLVDDG